MRDGILYDGYIMVTENPGAYPVDPTTPIGSLRFLIGDSDSVPLTIPVSGQQSFVNFSDAQLQAFLTLGSDSAGTVILAYAAGYAYTTLAAQFAADSVKVTTADQAVDLTLRAESMRKLATEWFNRGDIIAANNNKGYFNNVYPELDHGYRWPAELESSDIDPDLDDDIYTEPWTW